MTALPTSSESMDIDDDIIANAILSAAASLTNSNITPDDVRSFLAISNRCILLRTQGDELFDACQYVEATRRYRMAFQVIMGNDFEVPFWSKTGGIVSQKYVRITDGQRIILMHCCNGIAQCRAKLKDLQGVCVFRFSTPTQLTYNPDFRCWTGLKKSR